MMLQSALEAAAARYDLVVAQLHSMGHESGPRIRQAQELATFCIDLVLIGVNRTIDHYEKLFEGLDIDSDGRISPVEALNYIQSRGLTKLEAVGTSFELIWASVDVDADGSLDCFEFPAFLRAVQEAEKAAKMIQARHRGRTARREYDSILDSKHLQDVRLVYCLLWSCSHCVGAVAVARPHERMD